MKKIFWIAAALALAGLCTASCTEEELPGADATTSPLAGTLHLGAVMLDGAVISPSTRACPQGGGSLPSTRAWRAATGEAAAAAQEWRAAAAAGADTRVVTEDEVANGKNSAPNLVITGFEEGDMLQMNYNFTDDITKINGTTLTFNESNGWTTTDAPKPNPEKDETWAKASITLNYSSSNIELVPNFNGPLGISQSVGSVYRYPDDLIADTPAKTANDLQPGEYHIDTQVGSPTLGQVTARLAHRRALLRLPADAIHLSITGYSPDFSHLHELVAKVKYGPVIIDYCRFTPIIVGDKPYWQAIVPATDPNIPNSPHTLTEFIALIGPTPGANFGSTEEGTPGNHAFPESGYTAPDGNLLANTNEDGSGTSTLLKPITITLPEGVTMERNTRYPLTLSLSPHTATVTVGSSAPGWGADEEEIEYIGDIKEVNGTYIVGTAAGLRAFAKIANGGNLDANCTLTADIDLGGMEWKPIGTDKKTAYTGTFDGAGHTVSGLTINAPNADYQGFFASLGEGAEVKNLTIAAGSITGSSYVGAIAGYADKGAKITACTNTGKVSGKDLHIGGIVGWNNRNKGTATITACINTGQVSGTNSYIGGIVGWNMSGSIQHVFWQRGTGTVANALGNTMGEHSGKGDTYHNTSERLHFTAIGPAATPATRTPADNWLNACGTYAPGGETGTNAALTLNAALYEWNKDNGSLRPDGVPECGYKFVLNTEENKSLEGVLPSPTLVKRVYNETDLQNKDYNFLGELPLRLVPIEPAP